MTREQTFIRSLAVYAVVLPVAILLGYQLSNPLSYNTIAMLGFVLMALAIPLILKWHHPTLFLVWNATAILPFVPGRPPWWLAIAFFSLGITIFQFTITRKVKFVRAPSVLYPLLFIGVVALVTAALTGGLGLNILGSSNVGGKRYILLVGGIVGFLAMTAHPIPANKVRLFIGLFLLGAIMNSIGDLLPYAPEWLYPLFTIFPVEKQGVFQVLGQSSVVDQAASISRLEGLTKAMLAVSLFLLARMGLKRVSNPRSPAFWFFLLTALGSTLGGFRSAVVFLILLVGILFLLEKIYRSPALPAMIIGLILGLVATYSFVDKLPLSTQRSLSILPGLQVDPIAEMNARGSTEWRIEIWKELLPEIPRYLFLGKGLSMSADEMAMTINLINQGRVSNAQIMIMSGDYHSGPLSVIIPFGIWGCIGWIWFLAAGIKALYLNHRYSDPALQTINTFLLGLFLAKTAMFFLVFGLFWRDVAEFAGILGLSLALNYGIRRRVSQPRPEAVRSSFPDLRLAPSIANSAGRN